MLNPFKEIIRANHLAIELHKRYVSYLTLVSLL